MLDQGVHIGQDRVGGAAVVSPGCAGRDPGVGDQPWQQAAEVCAVLRGLVPHMPGVCCAGREHGHVDRPGDEEQRITDGRTDGGHRLKRVGASWTIG